MRTVLIAVAFLGLVAGRLTTPAASAAPAPAAAPVPVTLAEPPGQPVPADPLDGARCGDGKCSPPGGLQHLPPGLRQVLRGREVQPPGGLQHLPPGLRPVQVAVAP